MRACSYCTPGTILEIPSFSRTVLATAVIPRPVTSDRTASDDQHSPPISEPSPSTFTTSSSYVGACAGRQQPTHWYGSGGLSLCQWCLATTRESWGPAVRFTSTRAQS
ncbi:hypothetical protein QFZ75_007741 [Streptomyces sp. V3I8]|uniref:hypothetical protein n=1 Tax=Streptomyces sp. V3I8 TaxID=3042279 RepID=UPI00277E69A4|nr:hypothetical protein [Streptomyces sp. V3I8]MDQ1041325.1 hypothetical protein [Streptomyces sp. V3I8]